MIESHTFRGHKYAIRFRAMLKTDGSCDPPTSGYHKKLVLNPRMNSRRALEVAIHEGLHACFWEVDEKDIDKSAEDIARFLWRLNYRRISE